MKASFKPCFKMFSLFMKRKKDLGLKKDEKTAFRLPKNASPKHYAVCFKPNLEELSFEASVAIDITLLENSKQILFNAIDLPMSKVIWEEDVTQNRQEPVEMKALDKGQFELKFDPFLIPQKGQLRLNFRGTINDKKMMGFYRSKSSTNKDEYNLIAQFEPTDARRCLPCFDDISIKSEFDVCLIIPKGKTAVCNMPIKARYNHKRNPELEILEFKRSHPIPTYSLAFVVGQFDFVTTQSTDNEVLLRVYTSTGKKNQGIYALRVAAEAVTFLTTYFSCPFPLQKLDFMGIPGFAYPARESWGLVLCRDNCLLIDEKAASSADKQYIALVVCGAIVKQWIGNLVTAEWWNQLWINEGLCTFLRYVTIEEVKPEYESSTHFVTDIVSRAMRVDGLKSTRPLDTPVHSVLECEELYDEICYKKSAAVFRMLYNFIGEDHFKDGLARYISKYQFKNASTSDLWKCWEEVSNKPVSTVMNSWMTQRGYPVIKVAGKQDGKNRFIKITQEKFALDPLSRDPRSEGTWSIPITVTSEHEPGSVVFHALIDTKSSTIVISDIGRNDWIKFNPGVVGFYRVRYSSDMFQVLVHAIRNKTLEPVDRLNILDDKFALMLSGVGTTIEVLTLAEAFLEDDDYNVWCMVSYVFDKLLNILSYMNLEDSAQHFGRYLFSRILERVGFKYLPNEHHHTKLLRAMVFLMMVKFQHHETISLCGTMYDLISDANEVPPDLRYVVYYCAMNKGEEDAVKSFVRMYKESNSVEDKKRIAKAFSAVTDPAMIKYVLDFAIGDDVRKPDSIDIILALSKNRVGREHAWNFLKENITLFKSRYGTFLASKLVKGIIEDFATEEKALEIAEYFKTNVLSGTDRAVQLGIENIRLNEAWIKRERNPSSLKDYLDADAL